MAKEKMFIDGMRVSLPRESAPEYVKFNISFKVAEVVKFLTTNQNEQGWLNVDVKMSKQGNLYAELNTWQKGAKSSDFQAQDKATEVPTIDIPEEELENLEKEAAKNPDELPELTQEEIDDLPF